MPLHRSSIFDRCSSRSIRSSNRETRRQSLRRLFVETLETRQLLAGDFGDAPAPYPVLAADGGAEHAAIGPQLGGLRDMEDDGVPTDDASGDGADEDGVTFGSVRVGQTNAIVTVNVGGTTSEARLDAWIDFDGDGSWAGANEQIFDRVVVTPGDNQLTFDVPANAASGQTFSRFRISTDGNLGVGGVAVDGEVEDHAIMITPNLDPLADRVLAVNAGQQTISLTGLSGGFGETQSIRITATSSDISLIPDPVVTHVAGEDNASLTFTPVSGQRGTATITLTVVDAGRDGDFDTAADNATTVQTFDVRVTSFGFPATQGDRSPVISELVLSPTFGDRDTQQLIELRGAPNGTLEPNTYFVVVNEENQGRGEVREVFNLSGQSFGANGYLTIVQAGSPHAIHPQSTVLQGTTTGFAGIPGNVFSDADTTPGRIGGTLTLSSGFFLIQAASPPQLGDDIDADDDGLADLDVGSIRAGWSVLDSVSIHPFIGMGDQAYGQILLAEQELSEDPTTRTVEPGVPILVGRGSGYAARFGESVGSDLDDWVLGVAIDRDTDRSGDLLELFGFSTELPTRTLLLERALDHFGEANFFGGVRGTIEVSPAIGGLDPLLPSPPSTPAVGVQVLADTNGNGIRDSFLVRVDPDTIARPLVDPFAGPFDPIPEIPLTHAYPGVTISTAGDDNVPFNFEVRAIRETNLFLTTSNFIFSHAGVNFFNDFRRLRFDFARPANQVSIVAIGPVGGTTPTYHRIDAYNANDELIGTSISNPLFASGRQTIGVTSSADDIAYAVAYTDENFVAGASPFGRFDSFAYRQSEATATTDQNGQYELRGLSPGTYDVLFNGGGSVLGLTSQTIDITMYENFVISTALRENTLPAVAPELTININENTPVGTSLGFIEATDADGQALTFAIAGQNLAGLTINAITGELFVGDPDAPLIDTPSLLNFEENESFDVVIAVSDSVGTATTTVRLTLNDVNEAPEVDPVPFLVAEGTPSETSIGQVVAIDPDTAQSQTLVYQIIGGPDRLAFRINAASGLVTLIDGAAVDFEQASQLEFIVRVSDNGDTPRATEFTQFVRVIDQNDPPVVATTLLTIPENPTNPIVGRLTASDPDAAQTHTFELIGGTGAALFGLRNDGTVILRDGASLDFESVNQYSLIVRTIDSGAPPLASEAEVVIQITDVNEPPTLNVSVVEVSEDAAPGTLVAELTAIDPDADAVAPTITLLPGGNGANFAYSPSTGRLFVAEGAVLDFESTPVQTVVMRLETPATDTTPATLNDLTLTIRLTDANDPPIVVTERIVLSELAAPGTIAGRIQTRDPDAGDGRTLAIVGGNAAGRFVLGVNDGVVRVADGATFDADGSPEPLTLEIRVTDSAGATSTRVIDVVLNGVNEPPVFNAAAPPAAAIQSGEFFELVIPESAITDPEGRPFLISVFDQTGRLPAFLSFDPVTRTLSGTARPQSVGTYQMTIRAFEAGPLPLGSTQTFTLTVSAGDAPLTNKRDRFDVDASDRVSAIDALRVINFLSSFGSGEAISMERPFSGFLDVSGDGRVTALDAVQIINELAIRGLSSPESEQIIVNDDDDRVHDAAIDQYLQESMLF